MYRDRMSGDDWFGVLIDPFNDNDIGLWFWTTPAGVRGDLSIAGDGQGQWNGTWDTYWDVATVVTDDGWFAEMRIPLSSLGFQATGGRVEMAIGVQRYIPRKNEMQVFPAIPPDFDARRPSLARDAILQDVTTRRPVYVTPYVLTGWGQSAQLDEGETAWVQDGEVEREAGLDVQYDFTSNLTLDLTVNTDFAQVEADDQMVNLTRYSLFFPERRRFFQERAGVFDFSFGGPDRLFYSRQVGLADGEAVRILGGARLVGRVGEWDVGALDMQTARSAALPAENFGVLRLRRRAFNAYSNIGAMLATRVNENGGSNVGYGVDGMVRLAGDDYVLVRMSQTADDGLIDSLGFRPLQASAFWLYLFRARQRGFRYDLSLQRFGADFQPDMGFVQRRDFSSLFAQVQYFYYPEGDGPLRRIDPFQLFGSVVVRNEDRSVESAFIEHDLDFIWRSGARLGLDVELYYEDLQDDLGFPESTVIPVGSYTFPRFEFDYSRPPGGLFRWSAGGGAQQFYDGWRANVWLVPRWNLSRHLELNAVYTLDVVRFPDRDQGFDAHIFRLRVRSALDTKLSLNAFLQFSNAADYGAANVRLRYNFREGNDLWVVYNEGFHFDRARVLPALPTLPRSDTRTMVVKYTHTLAW